MEKDFKDEMLYGEEDFVIQSSIAQPSGGEKVRPVLKAKIGKVFIECHPEGEESFSLSIKEIDGQNKKLRDFFNIVGRKRPEITFVHLVPIAMQSFYPERTGRELGGLSINGSAKETLSHA